MAALPQTLTARWLYAIKPASWPKLLVPMTLGQAIGIHAVSSFHPLSLLLGLLFTLGLGLFIVLLNDWGDQKVDTIKRELFPSGCSPKTIPDGILSARALLIAGLLSGLFAFLIALFAQTHLTIPFLGLGAAICLLTFVAYSLPPLRLNYRGGGELLEMLGVGALLPWWNAYLQSGELFPPTLLLLGGFVALSLASALASGLSDEVSDRLGGKTTFTTLYGNAAVRRAVTFCLYTALMLWIAIPFLLDELPFWSTLPALLLLFVYTARLERLSPEATTNAFKAQGHYKLCLHKAIWYGALAIAAALLLLTLLPSPSALL